VRINYCSPKAALLLLFAATPFLLGASSLSGTFDARILAAHNRERASLSIAPLRWSPALASSAQAWADHLAATGSFEHAPELPTNPEGENLWAGTRGHYSLESRVDAWIRERQFFKRGTFPENSTTGNVEDVGHYTQLMWRDTQDVGCAEATGQREDVLVCRYSNAGNYVGENVF